MTPFAPVMSKARIESIDVMRGFALFGIVVMNVHQLMIPFSYANEPVPSVPGESGVWLMWAVNHSLFQNRFVTLFSLLFGMSFGLQSRKADEDPYGFALMYKRRLLLLAALGVGHALLLYFADVLFIYACAGTLLFLCRDWDWRRQAKVGIGVFCATSAWTYAVHTGSISIVLIMPLMALCGLILFLFRRFNLTSYTALAFSLAILTGVVQTIQKPSSGSEWRDYNQHIDIAARIAAIDDVLVIEDDAYEIPLSDDDVETVSSKSEFAASAAESLIFSQGTLSQMVAFRGSIFFFLVIYTILYFMWRTWGLFLIGSALMRWGITNREHSHTWALFVKLGLGVGLPLSVVATWMKADALMETSMLAGFAGVLHEVSAPFMALGMAGAILFWCESDRFTGLRDVLAAAGKAALSNYIGHSLVLSTIACSYGFGLYGQVGHVNRFLLACVTFASLAFLSRIWLAWFRMGPLEWLWRCGTYLKTFPLRK